MKISLISDVHNEFADFHFTNEGAADVLIMSGDILIADDLYRNPLDKMQDPAIHTLRTDRAKKYREFLQRCSDQFANVVYVAGNHEFYHGKFFDTLNVLRDECSRYPNINFLEDATVDIDGYTFIGATLWTDCNNFDPLTLHSLSNMMNDFRIIRNDSKGYRRLFPADTVARHKASLTYAKKVIENLREQNSTNKVVFVSHHAPSSLSIHDMYKHDTLMNGGYYSDLSEFILDHPEIVLWTHGHMHTPFDYMMGTTRVVCNPRGYLGYEPQASTYVPKYLDI